MLAGPATESQEPANAFYLCFLLVLLAFSPPSPTPYARLEFINRIANAIVLAPSTARRRSAAHARCAARTLVQHFCLVVAAGLLAARLLLLGEEGVLDLGIEVDADDEIHQHAPS